MPAIALTDHGNMYGAIEFYKACRDAGIKPIIGFEAYVAERTLKDKEPGLDQKRFHLTLLAKNNTGYKNLIRLVTISNLEGYYYKPRVDRNVLKQFSEGIICLSGCAGGELARAIDSGNMEKAEEVATTYRDIFGAENYFLEVQHHPHVEGDAKIREGTIALGKKLGIPLVATQDSHYPCTDDHVAHETLLAIQTGTDTNDANKFTFGEDDFSFYGAEEAMEAFKEIPEAVENTLRVADMCNVKLTLGEWVFPKLEIPAGETYDSVLTHLTEEGLATHGLTHTKEIDERIHYELDIIKQKGFSIYLLIVADLLRHARKHGILTAIRGSVAGSLVVYLIGITNINPLEYKLPFERFLNPERPSAPDIDMDFADNRRDEMIEYAKQKYGADKVAQIGTFGTMMARGAVRDVARARGYPYSIGDRISKMIPMGSQGFPMTIDRAMEMIPELADAYAKESDTKEIIDLAKKLEGCVRHISVHAAGVVISPEPLYEFVPVQMDPKGESVITQYDMHAVEDAGLIKFDFLGIRNLAILSEAVELVKNLRGVEINLDTIPLDDKKTFTLLAHGDTMGLFQLGGSGMTRYLKELKPTSIHDINAMVALYRPGPMEMIPEYIERKHNPSLVQYLDPRMKDILDQSYGVITYQDDVMLIAIHLAGYTWLEADKLRKAMGKKIPAEMEAQKEKLMKGLTKHGLSENKAHEIWMLIEPFAAYGFNKAHAASYGRVAYQTAYMKAHYPVEYMCAILTAESGDIEKIAEIISECKKMGITVLPPDVNASFGGFTVVEKENNKETTGVIRFGLYTIKNLGTDIGDAIIAERKENGDFKSATDFLERITHKNLNKKSMEALIKSGSMDSFGERGQLLANMETMLSYNKERQDIGGQVSLFGASSPVMSLTLAPAPAITTKERLKWEKELLGLYVSGHPLERLSEQIEKSNMSIKKIREEMKSGMTVNFACIVEEVKPIITKSNDRMAFVKIADLTGVIETVIFAKMFMDLQSLLVVDTVLAVTGRVSERNGEKSVIIEKAKEI